jgi:hypothetical protein
MLRPIAFYSAPLSDLEACRSTTYRELAAIDHAVNYFRSYLKEKLFQVITDHIALVQFPSLRDPTGQLTEFHKLQQ